MSPSPKRVKVSSGKPKTCVDLLSYHNRLATSLTSKKELFFDNIFDMKVFAALMNTMHSSQFPASSRRVIRLKTSKTSQHITTTTDIVDLVADKGFDDFFHSLLNGWSSIDSNDKLLLNSARSGINFMNEHSCFQQKFGSVVHDQEPLLSLLVLRLCPDYACFAMDSEHLFMFVHNNAMQTVKDFGFVLPSDKH